MLAGYLYFNAAICLAFAAWCTISPNETAAAVGFALDTPGARSEYLVLYGGLQLGLGVFFAATAIARRRRPAGLLLAVCVWPPVAAYRLATVATYPELQSITYVVAGLEGALAAAALILALRRGRRRRR